MSEESSCAACKAALLEPYVKCIECYPTTYVCLFCFARGKEVRLHRNFHAYEIVRSDFTLLENGWTAADELNLLEAISSHGIGSWSDIGRKLRRNPMECRRHYFRLYLENKSGHFPVLKDNTPDDRYCPIVLRSTEYPPRPSESSTLQQDMSGYCPARADFAIEYDNYAELQLAHVDFNENVDDGGDLIENNDDEQNLMRELQHTMVDIYHRVVKERYRRKRLVRDYGLINFRRQLIHDKKFYRTIGANCLNTLRVFCRHMNVTEWEKTTESLHLEQLIRKQIEQLQECRRQGITRLTSARVYDELLKRRDQFYCGRSLLDEALTRLQKEQWMQKQTILGNIINGVPSTMPQLPKRAVRPLEIVGMPNYEKLNDTDKEFCSKARFTPQLYLEKKRCLAEDYERSCGTLTLGRARHLLNIDVNKTRKLYDFLMKQGVIVSDDT